MNILALIPARGGSKGVPRKNIKSLGGKALIKYTIESALSCSLLDTVVVSTEDQEIADVSKAAGVEVPFMRPIELARDSSPTIELVVHALNYFSSKNRHFEAVCLLQPTVPFRAQIDLENAILFFKEKDVDSLITVREVPHMYNPHWVFEEDADTGLLSTVISDELRIKRRQDLPKAYHRDGSVYLAKSEVILKHNSLYGSSVMHHQMLHSPNINIDTMEDWVKAERYIRTGGERPNESLNL